CDTGETQPIVEVAPLRPLARRAAECGAAERIAASLWNDVERGPSAVSLPHATCDGHLDFLRVDEIVGKARDAATAERRPDIHAVELNRAFVAASAARGEEEIHGRPGHRYSGVHVERQRLDD